MEYLNSEKTRMLKKGICTCCKRDVDGFDVVEGFFCRNVLQNGVLKCPLCDCILAFYDTHEYFEYTEEYEDDIT